MRARGMLFHSRGAGGKLAYFGLRGGTSALARRLKQREGVYDGRMGVPGRSRPFAAQIYDHRFSRGGAPTRITRQVAESRFGAASRARSGPPARAFPVARVRRDRRRPTDAKCRRDKRPSEFGVAAHASNAFPLELSANVVARGPRRSRGRPCGARGRGACVAPPAAARASGPRRTPLGASFGDDRASSILWNMIKESIFFSFEPPPEKPSKSPRQIPKCPGASEASPGSACRVVVVCKYFRETSFLGPPDTVSRERRCVGAPRRGPHRAPGRAPPAGAPRARPRSGRSGPESAQIGLGTYFMTAVGQKIRRRSVDAVDV